MIRGVHREWEFPFPVFPMGIPWEWEWTMYNLGTGMGIAMREWEGMGMSKFEKIPEPQDVYILGYFCCKIDYSRETDEKL